ncbi:uncharacterized protein SAPINGB_P000629 [Magnusiomyces paraingens]|uniref:FHA domain-containing protein n=1 Tax=Magnusiomyces paraingens TaxID=2606893 RepID=A0A5E8B2E7_9ASCO|nr:uncharacterized protein SAPINGB_P000629 [Saprochaete ingens]VVT45075.1 unnamed protein product [Saprochaete ingens]
MESSNQYAFAPRSKSCAMTPASPIQSPERVAATATTIAGLTSRASRATKSVSSVNSSLLPGFVPKFPPPDSTSFVPTTPTAITSKSFAAGPHGSSVGSTASAAAAAVNDCSLHESKHLFQLPLTGSVRPLSASRGYYPTPEPSSSTGGPGALSEPGAFHEEEDDEDDDAKCVPPSSPTPASNRMPMMASSPQYASLSDDEDQDQEEEEDIVPRLPDTKYMAVPGSRAASSPPPATADNDSFGAHMDTGVTRLDFGAVQEEDKAAKPSIHQPTQIHNSPSLLHLHHPTVIPVGQDSVVQGKTSNITTLATPEPFTVRSPLAAVTVARVPRSGRPVTIGRSSKSCDVALPSANRLVSRVHVCLRIVEPSHKKNASSSLSSSSINPPRLRVTCLGWNGCTVVVPAFRMMFVAPRHDAYGPKLEPQRVERVERVPDGVTDYLVPKGLEIEVDYVAGITIDVRGERALVELVDDDAEQKAKGQSVQQKQQKEEEEGKEGKSKQQTLRERRATKLNVPAPLLAPVNTAPVNSTAAAVSGTKPRPSSAFFSALHSGSSVFSNTLTPTRTNVAAALVTPTTQSLGSSLSALPAKTSAPATSRTQSTASLQSAASSQSAAASLPHRPSMSGRVFTAAASQQPLTPVTLGIPQSAHGTPASSARKRKSDMLDGALVGAYLANKGVAVGVDNGGNKREKKKQENLESNFERKKKKEEEQEEKEEEEEEEEKEKEEEEKEGKEGKERRARAVPAVRGLARSQSQRVALGSPSRRGLVGHGNSLLSRSQSMVAVRLESGAPISEHTPRDVIEDESLFTDKPVEEEDENENENRDEDEDEEENVFDAPSFQHIQQVVSTHLALSRAHSSPVSVLLRSIPSLGNGRVGVSHVQTVLSATPWIGVITRQGKDAAGKPLEEEYYYVPEKDTDADRRALVDQLRGRGATGLRACRKTHKQYYWKKPRN